MSNEMGCDHCNLKQEAVYKGENDETLCKRCFSSEVAKQLQGVSYEIRRQQEGYQALIRKKEQIISRAN